MTTADQKKTGGRLHSPYPFGLEARDGQRVITGDSTDVMMTLRYRPDCVITSPPYNKGIRYGSYRDRKPYHRYLDWTEDWVSRVADHLADDGTFWLVIGSYADNPWLDHDVARICGRHLCLQERIVWQKSAIIDGRRRGQYSPSQSPCFLDPHHEHVYLFTRTGRVPLHRYGDGVGHPHTDAANRTRWKHGRDLACGGDVWFLPHKPRIGPSRHPAQFPVSLPSRCIRLHGVRPDLQVLDPFGGLGTTALAAKRLGVNCTVIETDKDYATLARERLRSA